MQFLPLAADCGKGQIKKRMLFKKKIYPPKINSKSFWLIFFLINFDPNCKNKVDQILKLNSFFNFKLTQIKIFKITNFSKRFQYYRK